MPLNVLQTASDADQPADDGARTAPGQGARALLDHLQSTIAVEPGADGSLADNVPPMVELGGHEATAFARAVARQADQIQHLIDEINRLDDHAPLVELRGAVRDLYGVLNDVVLRMKQNTSEVTAKIGLLTGAVTIISGAPNTGVPHDLAILDGAIAAAERMQSLERLQREAGATILALEESASRGQHAVRDLSAGLERLNAHAQSDRNEIAGLHQRIGSTDQFLAQGLARVDGIIESGRNDIARLLQRIGSADRAASEGLTTLGERVAALRSEMGPIVERLGSVEGSTVLHAGFQDQIETLNRRLEDAERKTTAEINSRASEDSERFAVLMNRLETLEQKNQALSHDAEQMVARLQAAEKTIATMTQSQKALSLWQDRLAQVLAGPQLPAG